MASHGNVYDLITGTTVDELRHLLKNNESLVHISDEDLMRPLHVAVELEMIDHATLLIEFGANVNVSTLELKLTPLHMAARLGHLRLADVLLAAGADVNAKNKIMYTPLHVAIAAQDIEMARLLLYWGADGNAITDDRRQESPLLKAATLSLPLTQLLVHCGARVTSREVHAAILANKVKLALFLLNNLHVDETITPNKIGRSLLQSVTSHVTQCDVNDAVTLAQGLLDRGEDVNYCNQFGTVFHILVSRGVDAVSLALMDCFLRVPGRNVDLSPNGLLPPLLLALKLNHVEMVIKLVKDGYADVTGVRISQVKASPELQRLFSGLLAEEGQVLTLQGHVSMFFLYSRC